MDDTSNPNARPDSSAGPDSATQSEQRAPDGSGTNLIAAAIFVLGTFLIVALLALGIGLVRALTANPRLPAPSATPVPVARVADAAVYGGRPFTLFGAGWRPGQIVLVSLVDPARPNEQPLVIFSGEADAQGALVLMPTYPSYSPWIDLASVDVVVYAAEQGAPAPDRGIRGPAPALQAVARVPVGRATPTPTATPVPPTSTPTSTPFLTPTPTLTPTPRFTAWRGEYFSGVLLAGAPVLSRNDERVQFNWGAGSPDPAVPADNFSARWTRTIEFAAGVYDFSVSADDGVRLYVDNLLLIDAWQTGAGQARTREVNLAAGLHVLRVEYFEATGAAAVNFSYERQFADWKGEYFADRSLSGAPALSCNDKEVNFDWGAGSPDPKIPADGFSARWTRQIDFPAGVYRFVVRADDGARLYVDNALVLDQWRDTQLTTYTADVNVAAGAHMIVFEYYENTGGAVASLRYEPTSFTAWKGEYFANRDLSGEPALVRDDLALDFNWGTGAPAPNLPEDNFSARWTRTLNFDPGIYRLSLIVDDGARLFLDGTIVIDEWHDGSTTYSFATNLSGGPHSLRVEHYEHAGRARVTLTWIRLSDTPTPAPTPMPTSLVEGLSHGEASH